MKEKQIIINKNEIEIYTQIFVVIVLAFLLFYNLSLSQSTTGLRIVSASSIIPTGIPEVYGEELGIQYDFVNPGNPQLADQTIAFLSNIDKIETLTSGDLERYINILYIKENGISCEYCCGARSIIFENGQAACGCAHSYAMRGLAKYLILNHPELTDEEILIEIGKWKTLFFPGIMEGKAQVLEANGIDSTDYINLASNKYRGIEQGKTSGGGMVGGC